MKQKQKPNAQKLQRRNDSRSKNFEITFEIETGNLIHRRLDSLEELTEFVKEYANNSKKF